MRPVQVGDVCEVVGGLGQRKSPNLGLRVRVRVVALRGEHSRHGRIWACTGDGVCQLSDGGSYVVTGAADFAAEWLRKLPPDAVPPKAVDQALTA